MNVDQEIALETLKQVNRALARGESEYDFHPIQSAKENAIDGMKEAGFTHEQINQFYNEQ